MSACETAPPRTTKISATRRKHRTVWLPCSALLIGWLSAAGWGDRASAQNFRFGGIATPSGAFIEPPRSVRQRLREAREAKEQRRWSDVVVTLGDLLSGEEADRVGNELLNQDYFLNGDDVASGQVVRESLLRTARRLIGELPDAALDIYELRYGAEARGLLSDAAAAGDWLGVGEVRRRFFHTAAGYQASLLLSHRAFLRGHPLAARLLLDDVVAAPRSSTVLGDAAVELAEIVKLAEIVAAEPSGLSATDEKDPAGIERFRTPTDYAMFGGRPDRNGGDAGQMPLSNVRWMLNTTASPRQQRALTQIRDGLATSGALPPPSWTPLRVGDQLMMRTTERLVGVDHRTGKRVWTYPWQSPSPEFESRTFAFDRFAGEGGPDTLLTQRVWNDVPYGQLTSDGEAVYMLTGLGEVEMISRNAMLMRGTRPSNNRSNQLVALEIATEGKLRWRIGNGADRPGPLEDAFFLGPPLPLGGRLYVITEWAGDIHLICLDSKTGDLIWRQTLLAIESGGIETDPIRRIAGAMPTYHEGVLICPTGAGAIVALDLCDRSFRWGVRFDRGSRQQRALIARRGSTDQGDLMRRWDTTAVMADGRSVIATPVETERLVGLDLVDGSPLFEPINRTQFRYLAGIRDQYFLVAGATSIRGFDVATGRLAWTTPREMLAPGQIISGRGVFGERSYFIPTNTNELIQIRVADGSVIDRRTTTYPLGNLIAVDGEIISQDATKVAVALGEASLEQSVQRRLRENPRDLDALIRKSELLIQAGDRVEALRLLDLARQIDSENDDVDMLTVAAILGNLRENQSIDSTTLARLQQLIESPTQKFELLTLMARTDLATGKFEKAVDSLVELSEMVLGDSRDLTPSGWLTDDTSVTTSIDAAIAARVQAVATQADADTRRRIADSLSSRFEDRLRSSDEVLRRIHRQFLPIGGVAEVRRELIDRGLAQRDFAKVERLICGIHSPTADRLAELDDQDLATLLDIYQQGKLLPDARRVDAILRSRDVESASVADSMTKSWPDNVSAKWKPQTTRIPNLRAVDRASETVVTAGATFRGWDVVSESNTPLALRDPLGNMRVVPIERGRRGSSNVKLAVIDGSMMVVANASHVLLIDLFHLRAGDGEAVRAKKSISPNGTAAVKTSSRVSPFGDGQLTHTMNGSATNVVPEFRLGPIIGDRYFVLQGGELIAADLFTGDPLWRNASAPASGVIVCDGDRLLVVSGKLQEVVEFDLRDGRRIGSRPWPHGSLWQAVGRHVLCHEPAGKDDLRRNRRVVRLVDPIADEVVLSTETFEANRTNRDATSTYASITRGRYLTLHGSDGGTTVWDLVEGEQIADLTLPAHGNLQGLATMMIGNDLIVMPRLRDDPDAPPAADRFAGTRLQTKDSAVHVTCHAVHAIDLKEGGLRWSREFDVPWGCTISQPAETPVIVLARSVRKHGGVRPSSRKVLDVLALDVGTGDIRYEKLDREIVASNNQLQTRLAVQPAMNRVVARIGPEMVTLMFTDEAPVDDEDDQP